MSEPSRPTAKEIAAKVNTRHLHAARIEVEVNDNMITLKGTVRSFYYKQLAQKHAEEVSKGMQIDNQIDVS